MSSTKFPKVQGGGSLILAWQVHEKPVMVIGGGEVAAGRILHCLNADANITLICPRSGLTAEVAHRLSTQRHRITHIDRLFHPSDLDRSPAPALVLCAVDDAAASSAVYEACRARRIPANIADVPAECDFYFGSVLRQGPLQILVSTNGKGPRMAALVRRWIARNLPVNVGAAVERVGVLRNKLRELAPAPEDGQKRMRWISKVCDMWTLEEFCEMTEEDMNALLNNYEKGDVPSLRAVRGDDDGVVEFDGSFGWWI